MLPPLIVLFTSPLFILAAFRKYPVAQALVITLLAGFLLLPTQTELDLPLLPSLNKDTIPALIALLAALVLTKRSSHTQPDLPDLVPRRPIARLMIFLLIAGALLTIYTNQDPLVYGYRNLKGLEIYDGFSAILTVMMALIPFVLAYKFLAAPQHQRLLLGGLVIAALLYSVPILYELRMSPQVNRIVYGFFPHSFAQHIRGSGYRPLVFLDHGLVLSLFLAMSVMAAAGFWRVSAVMRRPRVVFAGLYLIVILVLSKSLGAVMITILLLPIVMIASVRVQLFAAVIVAVCVLTYPVMRSANIVPVSSITRLAEYVSKDRAISFQVRLYNEDILLAKAKERPVFGWGAFGRSRVYNSYGRDLSITDGYWIIVLGAGGWTRYIAEFGLMTLPLFFLAWRARSLNLGYETSTLALLLAANLLDFIPNSGMTPITWLISGALWGRLAYTEPDAPPDDGEDAKPNLRAPLYSRPRSLKVRKPKTGYARNTILRSRTHGV